MARAVVVVTASGQRWLVAGRARSTMPNSAGGGTPAAHSALERRRVTAHRFFRRLVVLELFQPAPGTKTRSQLADGLCEQQGGEQQGGPGVQCAHRPTRGSGKACRQACRRRHGACSSAAAGCRLPAPQMRLESVAWACAAAPRPVAVSAGRCATGARHCGRHGILPNNHSERAPRAPPSHRRRVGWPHSVLLAPASAAAGPQRVPAGANADARTRLPADLARAAPGAPQACQPRGQRAPARVRGTWLRRRGHRSLMRRAAVRGPWIAR